MSFVTFEQLRKTVEGLSSNGSEGLGGHAEGFEQQNQGVTRRAPGEGPKVNGGRSQSQEMDSFDQPQYGKALVSDHEIEQVADEAANPDPSKWGFTEDEHPTFESWVKRWNEILRSNNENPTDWQDWVLGKDSWAYKTWQDRAMSPEESLNLIGGLQSMNKAVGQFFPDDVTPGSKPPSKKPLMNGRDVMDEIWDEKIPGGLASGKDPSDFDQSALSMGIDVEMEHTTDSQIAIEIAMDHLEEDPEYYDKLEKMEGGEMEEDIKGMKQSVEDMRKAVASADAKRVADKVWGAPNPKNVNVKLPPLSPEKQGKEGMGPLPKFGDPMYWATNEGKRPTLKEFFNIEEKS